MASSSSTAPPSDAATEAAQLEELINETLRRELQSALDARDKLYEKIAACMELRTNCQQLLERGQRELKTMVNLGSDFYVQAHVPDTGWIYVDVGLGFHAQMTLDEACAFATQREAALNARVVKEVKGGALSYAGFPANMGEAGVRMTLAAFGDLKDFTWAEADDGLTCGGTVEYEDVDTAKAAIDKYDGTDMGLGTTQTLEPQ